MEAVKARMVDYGELIVLRRVKLGNELTLIRAIMSTVIQKAVTIKLTKDSVLPVVFIAGRFRFMPLGLIG